VITALPDHGNATAKIAWQKSLPASRQIHARLGSRLLINVAGSVLENAGLNLDRHGIAFLPGSAVKACARRTAIASLRQWCQSGEKPLDDDLLAPTTENFDTPGDLLFAILKVFGCTAVEWSDFRENESDANDLAWACGPYWTDLRDQTMDRLNAETNTPDDKTPTRRGILSFLPSYPYKLLARDLELDVLTPHHKKYYEGHAAYKVALDTEDPVPVFFPAVADSTVYTFTLHLLAPARANVLDEAVQWLRTGLKIYGLGAKTAAGYGWFTEHSDVITNAEILQQEIKQHAKAEEAARAKHEADLVARKAREEARVLMTPEQCADADLAERADNWSWLKTKLKGFSKQSPEDQGALLRWLAGPGQDRWLTEIKPGAAKGKKPWSQIIGDINIAKKALKINLP